MGNRPPIRWTPLLLLAFVSSVAPAAAAEKSRLEGSVIDDGWLPLVHQEVIGFYEGRPVPGELPFSANTSIDGSFQLDRQPRPALVCVRNMDRQIGGAVRINADQKTVAIHVVSFVEAHGRLLDQQGKPMANQAVQYGLSNGDNGVRLPLQAVTSDDGQFTLTKLIPGVPYQLSLFGGRKVIGKIADFKSQDDKNDLGDVRMADKPTLPDQSALALTGQVIDADGKPIEGPKVQIFFLQPAVFGARKSDTTKTAADGTFNFKRPVAPAVVVVRTKDESQGCLLQLDDRKTEITLKLEPLAAIHGKLLDESGQPIADSRILCAVSFPVSNGYSVGLSTSGKTAADGTYTVHGLFIGQTYTVEKFNTTAPPLTDLTTVKPTKAETIELGDTPLPKATKK